MRRAITFGLATLAFAACGAQAALSATAAAPALLTWVQPAGIQITQGLTMPVVSVAPVSQGAGSTGDQPRPTASGNARLTIQGQPGDVVSTTVPESFTVVRSGGQETLIVQTNTNAEYQIGTGSGAAGAILNGDTMSVDIGGSLALASAQNLVPGPYEGMLVVVVQYN